MMNRADSTSKLGAYPTRLVLVVALLLGSFAIAATPETTVAHHDLCSAREAGIPYRSGSSIRTGGDSICYAEVWQLETHVELWMKTCSTCTPTRIETNWSACQGCTYKYTSLTKSCVAGTNRYYYTRVKPIYLSYTDTEVNNRPWRQSSTVRIQC